MHKKIFNAVFAVINYGLIPVGLFVIGYQQVYPLFGGEFTQHLGSIEISYITMAKFIEKSWPYFSWQPNWYFGYPMQLLYTPLVPFGEYISHGLFNWSYAHAYRVMTAFSYCFTLVSVYLMCKSLFKNTIASVLAALSYAILPSIISLMYPEVAADRFGMALIEPRRFTILVRWGEGPHIVALMFMPLAAMFWQRFLQKGSKWMLILGAGFTTLTFLTNSVAAYGLGILVFAISVGQISEGQQFLLVIKRALTLGLVTFGLAAFWFNPLFLSVFFREGGNSAGFWKDQFPWGWLIAGGILIIYTLISRKMFGKTNGVTASLLFFLILFGLVNTYYHSGIEKLELVPQVLRLNTEVDLGLSLVIGAGVSFIAFAFSKINRVFYWITLVIASLAVIPLLLYQSLLVAELPKFTQPLEKTNKTLTQTAEYEVARTLEIKISVNEPFVRQQTDQGERVFVPGNYGFYLNYFSDLPQLRGALFQSSIHPWPDHIYYQIVTGDSPKILLTWLKISNIGWLVLSGPRDIYRDFKADLSKFDAVLTLNEEKNGDRYYKVPLVNPSLAKLVQPDILDLKVPVNAIDEEALYAYADKIEMISRKLNFVEVGNGKYEIYGQVNPDEWVLVQMAYAPGWTAFNERGRSLVVKRDPLGFILVKPEISGMQKINLRYTTSWQVWCGWLVTFMTLIGLAVWLVFGKTETVAEVAKLKPVNEDEEE